MRSALAVVLAPLVLTVSASASTPNARILFEQPAGSSSDLVQVDADATSYTNLTPGQETFYAGDSDGSWSPDGSKIVFTSHRDSNVSTEIYVMNGDGSNQRRLTHDGPDGVQNSSPEIFDIEPAWSPLGAVIAYLKDVRQAYDVWLMDPDGGNQRRLTFDGGQKTGLTWAPGGARLVYWRPEGTYAVPATGGPPVQLVPRTGGVLSPDGSQVAYGAPDGLWVTAAGGGPPSRLSLLPAASPAWSPDGSRVAFVGTRTFPELSSPKFGPPTKQDIYTVGADGSDLHRLTGPAGDEFSFAPTGAAPTWWPDGARLFFLSARSSDGGGIGTTYQMNPDGSCEGPFVAAARLLRPAWRPGSRPGLGRIQCVDLRLTPVLTGGFVNPTALGQETTFTFSVDNDGSQTATGTRLEVKVIGEIGELLPRTAGCGGAPRDLVCVLDPIPPRTQRAFTVGVRSKAAGSVRFSVGVNAIEPESDPSTNSFETSAQVLPCTRVGTWGDDVIYGTPGPDRICALPGRDEVYGGPGDDYLDSGNGSDIVAAGPGHDTILSRGGNDTIYAGDGQRDYIDCGSERDIVIADRVDHVSHCETVVRPKKKKRR